jgi:hypothetical protein
VLVSAEMVLSGSRERNFREPEKVRLRFQISVVADEKWKILPNRMKENHPFIVR